MNIVEQLQEEIKNIQSKINKIQENCSHPDVERVMKFNICTRFEYDDRHWYACKCNLCFNYWTEDQ